MIIYKDIEQQSLEWFELKWGKVGGTLAKQLFIKSDSLFIDLLSQHIEEFEPSESFSNEHTERGNDLEPFALDYLSSYTGFDFLNIGWIQSGKNEILGISPDGITVDNKICAEIKCLGRKKHTEAIVNDSIPLEYIHQCVHYFTVNEDLEKLYFLAFRPESSKHFIKELTLESMVNVGSKSKPRILSVEAVRDYSLEFSDDLLKRINEAKNSINF